MAIKPSPRFALLLLLLHIATVISVYATVIPASVKWPAILLVVLNLIIRLARDVLLSFPGSWRVLALDKGDVSVGMRNGSGFAAQVADATFVHPYFIVLRVKLAMHGTASQVIFSDALSASEYRELCIHLKYA